MENKIDKEKDMQERRDFYEMIRRRTARVFCANAIIGVKNKGKKFEITEDGCKNRKRNGSKFCQECSDKHNGK